MKNEKIIFLHGWATDSTVWRETHIDSKEGLEYLDLTLPGHSLTSPSRWVEPTLDVAVEKLLEDTSGQDGLIGVGWSLGGQVLLETASQYPEKFKALVLIGVSPRFTKSDDFKYGQSPALVKRMMKDVKADCGGTLKRFYKLNFAESEAKSMEAQGFIKYYEGIANFTDSESLYNSLEALYNMDIRDSLKNINIPTLIIHGDKDNVCPVEVSSYMHEQIKGSTLKVYKGAGHAPFITMAEEFSQDIQSFIKKYNEK